MTNYIETKLRYGKMSENGVVKKVNEHMLSHLRTPRQELLRSLHPTLAGYLR